MIFLGHEGSDVVSQLQSENLALRFMFEVRLCTLRNLLSCAFLDGSPLFSVVHN